MARKVSAAMQQAERFVKAGKGTPADAARKFGLSGTAIYQAPWYRIFKFLKPVEKK